MEDFVHLHVHSQYSLLDGQSSIKGMVNKAIKDGMRGMALTDHGNMFGVKELYDYCTEINKKREEKKRMEEARQRLIREAQEAKGDAENFIKNKGMYLGITFGNKDIVVTVLDSIDAYIEEGAKMHHCVFQCKYYNKNNSLILSAKDINGNRLATIELSLIDWNILQCRGVDNSRPSQYDEIVSLVNNNIGQFQQAKLKLAS